MVDQAKIVNVIEVTTQSGITYFTLEGIKIGGFIDGKIKNDDHPPVTYHKKVKPPGGIVGSMNPKQAKHEQEKDEERLIDKIRGQDEEAD